MTPIFLVTILFIQAAHLASSFLSAVHEHRSATLITSYTRRRIRRPNNHKPTLTQYLQATNDASSNNNNTQTPPLNNKVAIVFLHGLGDSPEGWSKLSSALPNVKPSLASLDITYVFPPAHMVGITVNGGEQMPGWFDVYDWPIGIDAKDDPKGLALSVKRVQQIVDQLREEEGIDPSRIILGGFSQGGAVALMAAYNRRKADAIPFAGCCVLSGWLPMKDYLEVSEVTASSTPLFWAHGQYDDKILFEQQILGVKKLESVGVDVTSLSYPVGHESANFEEIEAMAEFIERVLGTGENAGGKKVKWANDEQYNTAANTEEDEINSVLYYLCALGMESS